MKTAILELGNIHKHYNNGDSTVRRSRGVADDTSRRIRRHHGTVRLRQVHLDEYHRLPRSADFRQLPGIGQGGGESFSG